MLVVQKFGGTSVGTIDRMREVAKRCVATQRAGHDVVVIVSAMSGETNRLLGLAKELAVAYRVADNLEIWLRDPRLKAERQPAGPTTPKKGRRTRS